MDNYIFASKGYTIKHKLAALVFLMLFLFASIALMLCAKTIFKDTYVYGVVFISSFALFFIFLLYLIDVIIKNQSFIKLYDNYIEGCRYGFCLKNKKNCNKIIITEKFRLTYDEIVFVEAKLYDSFKTPDLIVYTKSNRYFLKIKDADKADEIIYKSLYSKIEKTEQALMN